jgi:Domain of unknown function (DUF4304)
MSEISSRIDAFLRENLDPILKREGFRKKRRTYKRVLEDRVEIFSVEASTWNREGAGQFTVTLAVVIPSLAQRLRGLTVDIASAKGYESGILTLLGWVMPDRRQDSWKIRVGSDNHEEAMRFHKAVEDFALPWFRRTRTEDSLIQILEESKTMDSLQVLAILFSARNQSHRAQAVLQEVLRRRPDAEAWLREWSLKAGVPPPSAPPASRPSA